ncbi:MAG TPA: DUF58 domain-containing protein [Arenicellales bacterium]|nr:DUF58 domain-containing protein [Arenicellales bacterium]
MLPTPHGLVFTLALLVMLLIAVNYNNGLAYGFVFLVAGMMAVSMLFTHRNLSGLRLAVSDAEPVFAGEDARFAVRIANPEPFVRQSLWLMAGEFRAKASVPGGTTTHMTLPARTSTRGYFHPPAFRLSSAYPFGLLYTWSAAVRAPEARALVYPRPAGDAPLPRSESWRFEEGARRREGDDFVGLRDYQSGDSPRHVHWKAAAASQALVTKQFGGADSEELWLDWDATTGDSEARLSQLTRWVCDAEREGLVYGLRMPGRRIEPGSGPGHRHQCLRLLALWGIGDAAPV